MVLSDRDLFVKRVTAEPGDRFQVLDKQGTVQVNGHEPSVRRDLCTAEPLRLIEQYVQPTSEEDGVVIEKKEVWQCWATAVRYRLTLVFGDYFAIKILSADPLCGSGHSPDLEPFLTFPPPFRSPWSILPVKNTSGRVNEESLQTFFA